MTASLFGGLQADCHANHNKLMICIEVYNSECTTASVQQWVYGPFVDTQNCVYSMPICEWSRVSHDDNLFCTKRCTTCLLWYLFVSDVHNQVHNQWLIDCCWSCSSLQCRVLNRDMKEPDLVPSWHALSSWNFLSWNMECIQFLELHWLKLWISHTLNWRRGKQIKSNDNAAAYSLSGKTDYREDCLSCQSWILNDGTFGGWANYLLMFETYYRIFLRCMVTYFVDNFLSLDYKAMTCMKICYNTGLFFMQSFN